MRLVWLDTVKGAAIFLVVVGHALRGMHSAGVASEDLLQMIDSRIYAFHMHVFFIVSGWFFLRSLERATTVSFLKSRGIRLLWPLVIWTYIFLGLKYLAGTHVNATVDLNDLLILPFPGVEHLWFLWALLMLHVMSIIAKPVLSVTKNRWLAILLLGAAALIVQFIPLDDKTRPVFGKAFEFAQFFVAGMLLNEARVFTRMPIMYRRVCAVVFVVVLLSWPIIVDLDYEAAGTWVLAITFLAIWTDGVFGSWFTNAKSTLGVLGVASMAIYLTHTIFSASTRIILLGYGVDNVVLHTVLGVATGIIGGLACFKIAQRLNVLRVAGF